MLNFALKDEAETLAFAGKLAQCVTGKLIIYLSGPLGAGKTTFVRGFMCGLGYDAKVKSPTYTLVEPYHVNGKDIYHFDLYRLRQAGELEFLGIEEYFTNNAICIIEWPEKGFPLLPKADLACYIELIDQGRSIRLEALSEIGEGVLRRV